MKILNKIPLSLTPTELLAKAISLHRAGNLEDAKAIYHTLLISNPQHVDALSLLGTIYAQQDKYKEAIQLLDKTIAINPNYSEAHYNRGLVLQKSGQHKVALESYEKAFAADPSYAEAYWHAGLLKLLLGQYEEGWKLYEWRWKTRRPEEIRDFHQPLWLGEEPLAGKTILLYAEQGLGDAIQFCRYVPMVEALGAKVILEVPSSLAGLISTLKGSFHIVARGSPLPEFDVHCPLMSLPLAFKTSVDSIPADIPYLFADQHKGRIWQKRLGKKSKPRIGLVWSGSAAHNNDHNRSIDLNLLTPLLDCHFEYHSLQKEVRLKDEEVLQGLHTITSHTDALIDFSDTAALLSEMDLIISVDTAVAHLAGALGKPVWILHDVMPDFRWMLEREDSPWYPTARLFRQKTPGDWAGVIEKIAIELKILYPAKTGITN